jgi:O-acetylserine/cysteine efflux transporter
MTNNRRLVFAALIAAGVLWGTTVPLSKLALAWLAPAWLAFGRFAVAAAVLLLVAGRDAESRARIRAACRPAVLTGGALGYGGSVMLQNLGIVRTSVTHAALIVGATPVIIAIITAVWHRSMARPVAWAGFAVSLAGVGLVASGRGGGATLGGDGLVLASQLISAGFTVAQVRLLRDRDPVAVTGMQFVAAAVAALPIAVATEGMPVAPPSLGSLLAAAGLAFCGTVLPFTLFAYAQSRVAADVAGAFLNLEPLVGAVAGAVAFGNPVGLAQAAGGAAILIGIVLSSLQLRRASAQEPAAKARTADDADADDRGPRPQLAAQWLQAPGSGHEREVRQHQQRHDGLEVGGGAGEAHAVLVDQRVARDADGDQQGDAGVREPALDFDAAYGRRPDRDEQHPGELARAGPVVQRDQADQQHEHRCEAAREREHEAQLGPAVGRGEEGEVDEFQDRGRTDVRPRGERDVTEHQRRREQDDGDREGDRGHRLGIARLLDQEVPHRTRHCRQQGQHECRGRHQRGPAASAAGTG